MQNTFEILDKNNNHKTNEAIKEIKKLQLKMLSQELEKNISEKQIASSMNTTLEIIGLYFDLYGEDQGFNQYDGDIINHFNYLKKCLNEGNKFWSWNINSVNSLKKSCPQRLSGEFDKVLKIAEFDSKHI